MPRHLAMSTNRSTRTTYVEVNGHVVVKQRANGDVNVDVLENRRPHAYELVSYCKRIKQWGLTRHRCLDLDTFKSGDQRPKRRTARITLNGERDTPITGHEFREEGLIKFVFRQSQNGGVKKEIVPAQLCHSHLQGNNGTRSRWYSRQGQDRKAADQS